MRYAGDLRACREVFYPRVERETDLMRVGATVDRELEREREEVLLVELEGQEASSRSVCGA